MAVVEDVRKVLQDFLAPELRSIDARLDGLEKRVERMDSEMKDNHRQIMQRFDLLLNLKSMEERLTRVEQKLPQ